MVISVVCVFHRNLKEVENLFQADDVWWWSCDCCGPSASWNLARVLVKRHFSFICAYIYLCQLSFHWLFISSCFPTQDPADCPHWPVCAKKSLNLVVHQFLEAIHHLLHFSNVRTEKQKQEINVFVDAHWFKHGGLNTMQVFSTNQHSSGYSSQEILGNQKSPPLPLGPSFPRLRKVEGWGKVLCSGSFRWKMLQWFFLFFFKTWANEKSSCSGKGAVDCLPKLYFCYLSSNLNLFLF